MSNGEWDEMEESMRKALREGRRKQIGLDVLIACASFAGGCLGMGWTAKAYLGALEHKIDQIATMNLGQAEQLRGLTDSNTRAHDRVSACETRQAVGERAFTDLKENVRDIQLRAGAIVRPNDKAGR